MVVPNNSKKEQTLKLIEEKERLERKINECGQILNANGNVGMTGSLIDSEGFPRNDIDVYQVRHARNQIICYQNDLKELMSHIEKNLHEVHKEATESGSTTELSSKTAGINLDEDMKENDLKPIVKVNLVSPGSPAEDAGLRIDDEIIEFGSININNFRNNILQMGEIVKPNQRIHLKVKRGSSIIELNLIPQNWSGRGLLGCNIILLDSVDR